MAVTAFQFELRGRLNFEALSDLMFQLTGTEYTQIVQAPRVSEARSYDGWTYRITEVESVTNDPEVFRFVLDASADDTAQHHSPRTVREFPEWCDKVFPREGISVLRLAPSDQRPR